MAIGHIDVAIQDCFFAVWSLPCSFNAPFASKVHAVGSVQICVYSSEFSAWQVICGHMQCGVFPRWACHTKCGLSWRRIFNCIAFPVSAFASTAVTMLSPNL